MSQILIVDDHEQNRYLLRTVLTACGYEVLEATNGAEALEVARRTHPDLIISDILMPQMDGFALCRECKRDETLQDIPFVFYTATYTDPRDEALGLQLGAARFIVKPIENDEFIAILKEVLRTHQAGQLTPSQPLLEEETVFYRLYNEALIRKLEDKMLDLEESNRRLGESEARFRRLAENAQDLIYRCEFTPQRSFTYVNPAATAITGYTPEEYYADPDLTLKLIHPDDRPLLEAYFRGRGTFREPLVLRWIHKDGRVIWMEHRNIPIFDEAGNLIALEGIARDITERIKAEEERARIQAQLQQAEKLQAIGQLASGIAHDFNNVMAVIVLCAGMLARSERLTEREREQIAAIIQQGQHAARLIQQILDFSRQSLLDQQPLDLLPLVKEQVKLLKRTLPEHIDIVLNYEEEEYVVSADLTRMQQVIMNLAINARDAMSKGGTLCIALARIEIEPGAVSPLPEMKAGAWVKLTVSDTGTGIAPDVLPHIFDPFFTTKGPQGGSGLGLAQVYGIVGQHGGHIEVQTEVGAGTTFIIYLPALEAQPVAPPTPDVLTTTQGRGEVVLVVEDEEAVRTALVRGLEQMNYQTLEAANGEQALEVMKEHGERIALVLSDMVMPVTSGTELLHALRQQGWETPVILLTGYLAGQDLVELRAQEKMICLPKPCDLEQLAQAIASALSK